MIDNIDKEKLLKLEPQVKDIAGNILTINKDTHRIYLVKNRNRNRRKHTRLFCFKLLWKSSFALGTQGRIYRNNS